VNSLILLVAFSLQASGSVDPGAEEDRCRAATVSRLQEHLVALSESSRGRSADSAYMLPDSVHRIYGRRQGGWCQDGTIGDGRGDRDE
jgi:hypothetical protein